MNIRKTITSLILALVAGTTLGGASEVPEAPQTQAAVPQVAQLEPFTPEANYMSLAGYLRYKYYADTGIWLSRDAAVALVDDQIGTASR